jgi:lathosterol oxidase
MDWLAGSRLHLVDVVLTRGAVLCALLLAGFEPAAMGAYVVIVAIQAVFVHANFAPRARWLERVLVMPRFHHWHHAAHEEAVNVNYAVHLPWLDRWFGTHHLPADAWPERYGLVGETEPDGFLAQLAWPFRRAQAP